MKEGQVYSIIKHSDSNECFTTLSFCPLDNRQEWIMDVADKIGCKAVGAFIIRSIKSETDTAPQLSRKEVA